MQVSDRQIAPPTHTESTFSLTVASGVVGAVALGASGAFASNRITGSWKKTLLIGGGLAVAGGIAAALLGPKIVNGSPKAPPSDGRLVGVAEGRKMITKPDGSQEWALVQGTMHLDQRQGAAAGYATLSEAIQGAPPNQPGNGEIAYVREANGVGAFSLLGRDVDLVQRYRATDPLVVGFTTRYSGELFAGPGATEAEIVTNHLADAADLP